MYEPHIVIYHGDCDDGFGAAWAIAQRWPQITCVAGVYGQELDLEDIEIEGKNILFVDFSAPAESLKELVEEGQARSVVVIDHHKTAKAGLAGFHQVTSAQMLRYRLDNGSADSVVVWFDMEKSGARMAWDFAVGEETVPEMIALIEDRDLWRFAYGERTKHFSAALRSYPRSFVVWDWIVGRVDELIDEGTPILRAHQANVQKFLEEAYTGNLAGFSGVPFVNVPPHYASDAAHELLKRFPEAPYAAAWYRRADGFLSFSLCSEDSRADVSEIAQKFGGGGHRNAAGFELSMIRGDYGVGAV